MFVVKRDLLAVECYLIVTNEFKSLFDCDIACLVVACFDMYILSIIQMEETGSFYKHVKVSKALNKLFLV